MFPAQPGSYVLHLLLEADQELQVGKLGAHHLPAGHYLYTGSACGPGGLQARVNRHILKQGQPHWHIDYLRPAARAVGVYYTLDTVMAGYQPWECSWSQRLVALPEACLPVPGFGASDCHRQCPAHLIAFPAHRSDYPSKNIEQAICVGGVAVDYIQIYSLPDPFIDRANEVK